MNDTDTSTRLPLNDWHLAQGARLAPFAGYAMPLQFTGIMAEHEWTRSHASLFDVSHMGQITVSGDGAAEALSAIVPANLDSLKEGRMRYSFFLNQSGGIIDDLIIARLGDTFRLVVNGAVKREVLSHMRTEMHGNFTIAHNIDWGMMALQGPEAAAVLEAVVPGVSALGFMSIDRFRFGEEDVIVSRSGYTGEDGFEIALPGDLAEAFADRLIADERVRPAGLGARDSLRLEAGLPLNGQDLTPDIDPVSAGLTFALPRSRREAGGFIGHAALANVIADGPENKRVGLALEGRLPARSGADVLAGGETVGLVTSGCFSPTLGHPIAMAYVTAAHAAPGTQLQVAVRGKTLPAIVVEMPFVPHKYHRNGANG